jgi:hypothetical protein
VRRFEKKERAVYRLWMAVAERAASTESGVPLEELEERVTKHYWCARPRPCMLPMPHPHVRPPARSRALSVTTPIFNKLGTFMRDMAAAKFTVEGATSSTGGRANPLYGTPTTSSTTTHLASARSSFSPKGRAAAICARLHVGAAADDGVGGGDAAAGEHVAGGGGILAALSAQLGATAPALHLCTGSCLLLR